MVLHVWTQKYPQNVGTCTGFPLQLLVRNPFFQSDRPEPPIRGYIFEIYLHRLLRIDLTLLLVYKQSHVIDLATLVLSTGGLGKPVFPFILLELGRLLRDRPCELEYV